MAKTLKKLENGIRIKWIVRDRKYHLYYGNFWIDKYRQDDYEMSVRGFESPEDAEKFAKGGMVKQRTDGWSGYYLELP